MTPPSSTSPLPAVSNPPRTFMERIGVVLEMIKFQHSLFALPFALSAMLVAAGGLPPFRTFAWIVVACVTARSMAMAFNRIVDREYDARNQRTRDRALPAGRIGAGFAVGFTLVNMAAFLFSAAMLNRLCLALSPIVIVILLGYSYCKRFTDAVHMVLGLALGLAPLGAWIAVRGSLEGLPVFLAIGVILWTAGFDVIYSCQDIACDRREKLHSIPARVGIASALRFAFCLHVLAAACFALFILESKLGVWSWTSYAIVCSLLVGEHRMVRPDDMSRVGPAFFTFNAIVSAVFLVGCALDVLIR